jgi:hypothetical protein
LGINNFFERRRGVIPSGVRRGKQSVALVMQGVRVGGAAETECAVDVFDEAGDVVVPRRFDVGRAKGAEAPKDGRVIG